MANQRKTSGRLTRRRLLGVGAAGVWALAAGRARGVASPGAGIGARAGGVKHRPDLLHPETPGGIQVIQLTSDPEVPSSHVYMEAQIFTPDSKRFVLHRSAHAHGRDRNDPRHQYMLCDIENGFAMHPLTDELGTTGPSVSPDGKSLYYFTDQGKGDKQRLSLKRVNLDGTDRQTLMVIDGAIPGTKFRPRRPYPLSTISSDGRRPAISAALEGTDAVPLPFGLMVFDLEKASVQIVIHGPTWINMHPQYCRSADPELRRDVLIQENHGNELNAKGEVVRLTGGAGADIHVIRDDGSDFRDMPWGRDGSEFCQGHQCWRGRTHHAITSTVRGRPAECELIESRPVAAAGHMGLKSPGGERNILSRGFAHPQFYHFATDMEGQRLISDCEPFGPRARIYVARLGEAGRAALSDFVCVAKPRPSGKKEAHLHPFLSPDGRMGFFNSDESGLLQAYAVRGF